jgi:hypothetical protein
MPPWMPLNRRVLRTLSDHGNSTTVLMLSPSTPNWKSPVNRSGLLTPRLDQPVHDVCRCRQSAGAGRSPRTRP